MLWKYKKCVSSAIQGWIGDSEVPSGGGDMNCVLSEGNLYVNSEGQGKELLNSGWNSAYTKGLSKKRCPTNGAIKKKDIMSFAGKWIEVENIMLRKIK
jgi:hypothetical protein